MKMRWFILMFFVGLGFLIASLWVQPKGPLDIRFVTQNKFNTIRSLIPVNLSTPTTELTSATLKEWLRYEAKRIGEVDSDPSQTLAKLKLRANSLSDLELIELQELSENIALPTDDRFLAVYLISLNSSSSAVETLFEISLHPFPEFTDDRNYSDELVIRMHALESLVGLLPPNEAQSYLLRYLQRQANSSLASHARYLLERS